MASPAQGPNNEQALATASAGAGGPNNEQATIALVGSQPGSQLEEASSQLPASAAGAGIEQAMVVGPSTDPPVIEALAATQRDTDLTYLVDVVFSASDPDDSAIIAFTIEWSQSAFGPWNATTANQFDYKHTATAPLFGIIPTAPGTEFSYSWNAFQDLPSGQFDDIFLRLTLDDGTFQTSGITGPITVSTVEPDSAEDFFARQLAKRAQIDRTPLDFLGKGPINPFRRGASDIVQGEGVELVASSVEQILGIRASHGTLAGELPWDPARGSKLWILRHRKNDATLAAQAEVFVFEAMEQEPRAEVTEVFVERTEEDPEKLVIRVTWQPILENVPDNRVVLPEQTTSIVIA